MFDDLLTGTFTRYQWQVLAEGMSLAWELSDPDEADRVAIQIDALLDEGEED